jgi:hypothetical protein
MVGMKRQESRYRGWRICLTTKARRKVRATAARAEPPCQVIMSDGWGKLLVLKDLKRQIDAFEDGVAAAASHSGSGGSGATASQG